MEIKRAIVNFADQNGWYPRGQLRLIESCKQYFKGEVFPFTSYEQIKSPSHKENPYAFKVHAIEYVKNMGYNSILYLDSSLYPVKDITPVFEHIEYNGHLFQSAGALVDRWCNDNCRNYFSLSHEESNGMCMFSAGFTGLFFGNERSVEFFDKWKDAANSGAFKGDWSNHRHDMTAAGIIANRLKMNIETKLWMQYIGGGYAPPSPEAYFNCHPC